MDPPQGSYDNFKELLSKITRLNFVNRVIPVTGYLPYIMTVNVVKPGNIHLFNFIINIINSIEYK